MTSWWRSTLATTPTCGLPPMPWWSGSRDRGWMASRLPFVLLILVADRGHPPARCSRLPRQLASTSASWV
jgi:hypothetical protein